MTAVLTTITDKIDTAIGGMTTAGGYRFNYNNVNEDTVANRTYPYVRTSIEEEENILVGRLIHSITTNVNYVMEVTVDNLTTPTEKALGWVKEDIKRLFFDNDVAFSDVGLIEEEFVDAIDEYRPWKQRPGKTIIKWKLKSRVQRADPGIT